MEKMSEIGRYARAAMATAQRGSGLPPTGLGVLRVQVLTAKGTFPVEGAEVEITDLSGKVMGRLRTDRSGLTARTVLPCSPAALSLTASTAMESVVRYEVSAAHPNFATVRTLVEIFDGIETLLAVELVPAKGGAV